MAVVLITGCGSGIGCALASALAQREHVVVATLRSPDKAPAALKVLAGEQSHRFLLAPLDVTDAAMRRQAIDLTLTRFGRLDVLINNAGITATGSVEDTPETIWRRIFETNFFGPLELIRLALPIMRRQRAGRLINVTSVAALITTPLLAAYTASKHALDALSASLDIEARSFGVRTTNIMPGPFKTGLPGKALDVAVSPPYAAITERFKAVFGELEQHAREDLSPVIEAALAAINDPEPQLRYPVGTEPIAVLPAILQALGPLRQFGLHITGQD
jgi:NAD(P)-dependent dehydrogenase (short-subunit alcohol dehydrogenase family)